MSTFIKISGGASPLLQANQAQAVANRQAALERMSREKAGQQGKRERDARRKQEGLDKDGRVIYGVRPLQQSTQAPGVFLTSSSSSELPYFWLKYDYNAGQYTVISGNGAVSATASLSQASIKSYDKTYTAPTPPLDFFDYNFQDYGYRYLRDVRKLCTQTNSVSVVAGNVVYDGNQTRQPGELYTSRQFPIFENERYVYDGGQVITLNRRTFILPMGDGTAIYAVYAKRVSHEYTYSFYEKRRQTPISIWSDYQTSAKYLMYRLENVAATQSHTAQLLSDDESCVCFRVGYSRAEVVTPPAGLVAALKAKIGSTKQYSDSYVQSLAFKCYSGTAGGAAMNIPLSGNVCVLQEVTSNGTNTTPTWDVVCGAFPPSGSTNPTVSTAATGWTIEFAPGMTNEIPRAYGLTYAGRVIEDNGEDGCSTTPAEWYNLNGKAEPAVTSPGGFYTHDVIRSISATGIAESIGSLVGPSSYRGFPYGVTELNSKLLTEPITSLRAYKSIAALTGSIYESVPYSDTTVWTTSPAVQLKKPTSTGNLDGASVVFIYDWGKASFCKAQAARYGLS